MPLLCAMLVKKQNMMNQILKVSLKIHSILLYTDLIISDGKLF